MDVIDVWTGRTASHLRSALRLTNEEFAKRLGTAVRTVAAWNAEPDMVPGTVMQRALDTLLTRAPADARARFTLLTSGLGPAAMARPTQRKSPEAHTDAELRLAHDPNISQVLDWLDEHANWPSGEARRRVADDLTNFDARAIRDSSHLRRQVTREAIASALAAYYEPSGPYTVYRAACGDKPTLTSILTRPDWLDVDLILGHGLDMLSLESHDKPERLVLDEGGASSAVRRVAEAIATDGRIINMPLYDLLNIDLTGGRLVGRLRLTDFLSYALTLDLLHKELIDALAAGHSGGPETLPLRQRYLPDVNAVTQLESRICAGGPLALFAAARPPSRSRSRGSDYVILIQERSGRTLNEAGRLAVIPKAFHQPLMGFSDDAGLSTTIEREMEEELFGREEVDSTLHSRRRADPLHLSRLSAPLRWLISHTEPKTWRIECTGFGLNLVSGNYECASLIVIHDESWWAEFGGSIEANWETDGLRRYSTHDHDGLVELVHDPSWSNEGLFALLQGLRRLSAVGAERVVIPRITLEV